MAEHRLEVAEYRPEVAEYRLELANAIFETRINKGFEGGRFL